MVSVLHLGVLSHEILPVVKYIFTTSEVLLILEKTRIRCRSLWRYFTFFFSLKKSIDSALQSSILIW